MKTALDTSVLVDVLKGDATHGKRSRALLRTAYSKGALVVCSVVWAEACAHFSDADAFSAALQQIGVTCSPVSDAVATLAGQRWRREHPDLDARIPSELIIGAHATIEASSLLTRNVEVFRRYFPDLELVVAA